MIYDIKLLKLKYFVDHLIQYSNLNLTKNLN